jgi:hypothetical protein
MTTVIGGSSPSVTFPDSTVQNTAGLPLTGGTLSGTLVVPTISDGTNSTSSTNCIQGSAKAWVQFTGGTINASYNVSSLTTNGSGDYTVNFTNAFADNKYAFTGASGISASFSVIGVGGYAPTTSSCRFLNQSLNGSNTTPTYASLLFFR